MRVAGFGYRKSVAAEALLEVLTIALERSGIDASAVEAIAVAAEKQNETAVRSLATQLLLPLIPVDADAMQEAAGAALTHSENVMTLKGVPSIAETAALAAAGRSARLLAPRVSNRSATCAIAEGDGS